MTDNHPKVIELVHGWRRYLAQGKRRLRDGHYACALECFQKALQEAPEEPQVLLALGREKMRQGCYQEAEQLLRHAWTYQPDSPLITAALARLLGLHLHRQKEALDIIEQNLKRDPQHTSLRVIQGELLLEEGRYLEARNAFSQGLIDERSADAARIGLARTYNHEGIVLSEGEAFENAIFTLKRAIDLDPEWSSPWVNLGVVFGRMGKAQKARDAYKRAIEKDPTNPVAYYNLGTVEHEQGHLEQAVWAFEELMERVPDYPHTRSALANVLGELKQYDRAIALFLEELDVNPQCTSCWTSLGLAYLYTGEMERSEHCLLQAVALDARFFKAIRTLIALYTAQQRFTDLKRLLSQAYQLDPEQTAQMLSQSHSLQSLTQWHPREHMLDEPPR